MVGLRQGLELAAKVVARGESKGRARGRLRFVWDGRCKGRGGSAGANATERVVGTERRRLGHVIGGSGTSSSDVLCWQTRRDAAQLSASTILDRTLCPSFAAKPDAAEWVLWAELAARHSWQRGRAETAPQKPLGRFSTSESGPGRSGVSSSDAFGWSIERTARRRDAGAGRDEMEGLSRSSDQSRRSRVGVQHNQARQARQASSLTVEPVMAGVSWPSRKAGRHQRSSLTSSSTVTKLRLAESCGMVGFALVCGSCDRPTPIHHPRTGQKGRG